MTTVFITEDYTGYVCVYRPNETVWETGYWVNGEKEGEFRTYDYEGLLDRVGDYRKGKKEGEWSEFFQGRLYSKGSYSGGEKTGRWVTYRANGRIWFHGEYENGSREGDWIMLSKDLKTTYRIRYKSNKEISRILENLKG